ncbi:hypothetical protein CAter282_4411 [Collimonas arenae]|uniref:Uncharacterized protein n=1 Tax=Collimonas arenae TaxID=279058 RepID=A0A127QPS8_9BURK|nr:hypothetical protein CAter10_4792 [Collimonas arenae]AMP12071.1 hypothetical protein CAter282_4411 [Collimonas arenae]
MPVLEVEVRTCYRIAPKSSGATGVDAQVVGQARIVAQLAVQAERRHRRPCERLPQPAA